MALVVILIITGFVYRVARPIWTTLRRSLIAISIGLAELVIVASIERALEEVLIAVGVMVSGALLPDIATSFSAWLRRPQNIPRGLIAAIVGLVIYVVAFRPDLANSIVSPIIFIVVMIAIIRWMIRRIFR